jgi:hypothetical protein
MKQGEEILIFSLYLALNNYARPTKCTWRKCLYFIIKYYLLLHVSAHLREERIQYVGNYECKHLCMLMQYKTWQ